MHELAHDLERHVAAVLVDEREVGREEGALVRRVLGLALQAAQPLVHLPFEEQRHLSERDLLAPNAVDQHVDAAPVEAFAHVGELERLFGVEFEDRDFDTVGGSMVAVQENMAMLPAADRAAIAAYLNAIPAID